MTNNEFEKLSKSEQRVAIVKDAIAQVKAGQFIPKKNIYLCFDSEEIKNGDSIQEYLLDKNVQCEVCGVGGLMASTIRFANKISFDENENRYDWCADENEVKLAVEDSKIYKYFSKTQLALIESAFETCKRDLCYELETIPKLINKAIDFGFQYSDLNERFIKIMENIIENNGVFKP